MVKNSNFILIGLIIVNKLYSFIIFKLKSNDLNNIKSSVSNLVQQNKKRDEIMNHVLTNLNKLKEKDELENKKIVEKEFNTEKNFKISNLKKINNFNKRR